ncbi:MAG: hypothetical protein R6V19_04065 [Armatimonadota bacterium]
MGTKALAERVERLERQNRWLKIGAAVVAAIMVVAVLMGQTPEEKTIEADKIKVESLQIVDAEGKRRGTFTMMEGRPVLALYDRTEKPRIGMSIPQGEGPEFILFDINGRARTKIHLLGDEPRLTLCDGNEQPRAMLHLFGGPTLTLYSTTGSRIWQAP